MKISRRDAKEMGLDVPPAGESQGNGKGKRKAKVSKLAPAVLSALCKAHGIPEPIEEYEFARSIGRKWRFDYLWDWLVLEVEGVSPDGTRHQRIGGFLEDMAKYNTAVLFGYAILRCTPAMLESGEAFALVKQALEAEGEQP